jgi:hypothetical protein
MVSAQRLHTPAQWPTHTRAHHAPGIPQIFHRLRTSAWRACSLCRWAWGSVVDGPEVWVKLVARHMEIDSARYLRDAPSRDSSPINPISDCGWL